MKDPTQAKRKKYLYLQAALINSLVVLLLKFKVFKLERLSFPRLIAMEVSIQINQVLIFKAKSGFLEPARKKAKKEYGLTSLGG